MRKLIYFFLLLFNVSLFAQVDFSDSWEDFFSYNNVKDIVKQGDILYALSDNAIFTYDFSTDQIQKISSVQGLSGETTTSFLFDDATNRIVIGYENGLVEVVDGDGSITISADILNFNQSGAKSINDIFQYQETLYLSTAFAIVEYDVANLEFGDTFFIGPGSTDVFVNEITVFDGLIYAATNNGLYYADVTDPNLIDFNNWTRIQFGTNQFSSITTFNGRLFTAMNTDVFEIQNVSNLSLRGDYSETIVDLKASVSNLTVSFDDSYLVLNSSLNTIFQGNATSEFDYTLNTSVIDNNLLLLATQEYGVLSASTSSPDSFIEIHPEGPVSNDIFSVSAQSNHLWVAYGGYSPDFAPIRRRLGYTHYNGETWFTAPYDVQNPFPDFVDVTMDPDDPNRAFIGSFGSSPLLTTFEVGGLFEIQDNEIVNYYNNLNSPLEDISANPLNVTIRISSSDFDRNGALWVTNIGVPTELKKFNNGAWSSFDISAAKPFDTFGLTQLTVDRSNSVWIGTRGDGLVVFNENGNRLRGLNTNVTQGSLPNARVNTIAVDRDNRIWIGTLSGMVVFNNASSVFDAEVVDTQPIIILEDGVARRLLGEQNVTSIKVDGANNKWFGTDNGGVIYTNPNGQTTIATFNTQNSPLPSDRIVSIAVDTDTGKVYFATNKGIVAYNSSVEPFGEELGEVYAYPNPVRNFHNNVTITGRNGTGLPRGTNVKILDVSGNLVFETNVVEGQQLQGGKVVWDKTNLGGKPVASGVYIVLLANDDASETSVTKIAIIN